MFKGEWWKERKEIWMFICFVCVRNGLWLTIKRIVVRVEPLGSRAGSRLPRS